MRVTSGRLGQSDKARQRERRLYELKLGLIRERGNRCEFCGVMGVRLDSHHVTGRGNKVEEAWADHPAMLVLLCATPGAPETCHKRVHVPGSEQDVWALRTARERLTALDADFAGPLMTIDWLLERRLRDTGQIHGREWA